MKMNLKTFFKWLEKNFKNYQNGKKENWRDKRDSIKKMKTLSFKSKRLKIRSLSSVLTFCWKGTALWVDNEFELEKDCKQHIRGIQERHLVDWIPQVCPVVWSLVLLQSHHSWGQEWIVLEHTCYVFREVVSPCTRVFLFHSLNQVQHRKAIRDPVFIDSETQKTIECEYVWSVCVREREIVTYDVIVWITETETRRFRENISKINTLTYKTKI